MPKTYSTDEKMEAFRLLFETFGDTYYVSTHTGISERALQYWKSRYRLQVKLAIQDPIDPRARHYKDQYSRLRDGVLEQIDATMKHLEQHNTPEMLATLTPTLTRLIDRISKLEKLIDDKHFYFTVVWLNPGDLETDDIIIRHNQLFEF